MVVQRFELQTWECQSLLQEQTVGRICIIDHGCPVALPISYKLIGNERESHIVIRTAPGTLIGRYEGPSSLEVDHIDVDGRKAWSVIVRGKLRQLSGAHGLPDPGPWLTDDRHTWLVLDVSATSGRRFTGRVTDDGYSVEWMLDGL